jgi:hypothetical protein
VALHVKFKVEALLTRGGYTKNQGTKLGFSLIGGRTKPTGISELDILDQILLESDFPFCFETYLYQKPAS